MDYVVVDTDAFSYLWQKKPEAVPLRPYLNNAVPVLSCTSVAELYFGANLAGCGGGGVWVWGYERGELRTSVISN